ncbi:hypothetical protein AX14_008629 [Amanita brunnescens Koide BX004]|nr:hypothetical protein AX14_008629 [Amanita brunnescens Koide BX004]
MVISTNDYPTSVYLDFDYVIYTIDEPNITTSSTSGPSSTSSIAATSESAAAHHPSSNNSNKAGIIVGCVLGGLALVAILILFRRSRIKRNWPIEPIITSFNEQPFRGLVSSSAPLVPVRREGQSPRAPNRKDRGRDELRALRHMEIDSRLQTAQREMQNLASRQEAQSGPGPSSGDVEREGSGLEMVQMEAIHEQIRQLRTQMSQLRMERSSNWTQDAAPPPY